MKRHLEKTFPAHWRLMTALESRSPTDEEIKMCRGEVILSQEKRQAIHEEVNRATNNTIGGYFARQRDVNMVRK